MFGSCAFGLLGGLRIKFNASWLVIAPLLAITLAVGWFPARIPGIGVASAWALGIAGMVAYGLSILLHEFAHVAVARSRGREDAGETLYLFGSVSTHERATSSASSASTEVLVAFAGPLASLLFGILCWIFADVVASQTPRLAAFLLFLGIANVFVGLFNLIPTVPLDGARVLHAILAARGTPSTGAPNGNSRIGEVLYALCILAGTAIALAARGSASVLGIWLLLVGLFLELAARALNRRAAIDTFFRDRTVRAVMNPHPVIVPASMSLQQVVDEHFLTAGRQAVAVTQLGELVGLVALRDVHAWPREQWATIPVAYVMVPRTRLYVARPDDRLADALSLLTLCDINQVPVVEGNTLIGMLSRDIVLNTLGRTRAAADAPPRIEHPLRLPRAS